MKFLSALCLCLVLANLELGQGASLAQGETNIDIYIYLHPLYTNNIGCNRVRCGVGRVVSLDAGH